MNNKIYLSEEKLNRIISESIAQVLEEGKFTDTIKAGFDGLKQGIKGQRMLNRGTEDFKQNYSRDDEMAFHDPFTPRPENTAADQAKAAYKQYLAYQQQANKFLNLYNRLTKQYNLEKVAVGKRASKEKVYRSPLGGLGLDRPTMTHTKQTPIVGSYSNVK